VTARTIRTKERSAKAYQFPLDLVAGSEARTDYRNRGDDSCREDAVVEPAQSSGADTVATDGDGSTSGACDDEETAICAEESTQLAGNPWLSVGSLAKFPETDEYVFVLNVNCTHDQLQGVRTSRLSEETCAQIAAAGKPSQLERVADAVRLVTDGPHSSGDAQAYDAVSLETVVNPDLLMEAPK
jgi:hypothetical protein